MKTSLKLLIFLTFLSSFFQLDSYAQSGVQPEHPTNRPHAVCGTDDSRILETPEANAAHQKFLEHISEFVRNRKNQTQSSSNKTSANPNESKYIIPTVVHVVWDGVTKKDSIRYDQIFSQFVLMYNDFRKVPGERGFSGGVDMNIEFSLATKDPSGKPTTGVVYHVIPGFSVMNKKEMNGKLKTEWAPSWNTKKYFNIWLAPKIKSGEGGGYTDLAGYAQFPDPALWPQDPSQSEKTDGVVCINTNFGDLSGSQSNTYSSTMTHEIGHWLSHFHTFQGGCGGNCNTAGDGVCDTPPVYSGMFKDPFGRINSCNDRNAIGEDIPDMPRAYMDYTSPDAACNLFTANQRDRAHAALENPSYELRYRIWDPENVIATGAGKYTRPKANFWASNQTSCANEPIHFIDYSMSAPTKFMWRFPGGTPETSTEANPTVKYDKEGMYAVTLIIENESGIADSITKNDFIRIGEPAREITTQNGFYEDFTTATGDRPPSGWTTINEDAANRGLTWRFARNDNFKPLKKDEEQSVAKVTFASYSDYNQHDHLITPSLDLTKYGSKAYFIFKYAYSPTIYEKTNTPLPPQFNFDQAGRLTYAYKTLYSDTLLVAVSSNCGATWETLWKKGGRDLMTLKNVKTSNNKGEDYEYAVTSVGEWDSVGVDLSPYLKEPNLKIKFETISGFGNNLYLDNIEIRNNWVTARDTKWLEKSVTLAPNPFNGTTNAILNLEKPGMVQFEVLDALGRSVYQTKEQEVSAGNHNFEINIANQSAGVYFLKIDVNGTQIYRKLIAQ